MIDKLKEFAEKQRKRKCKCSHEKQEHKGMHRFCSQCACTEFMRHDRSPLLDKVSFVSGLGMMGVLVVASISFGMLLYDISQTENYDTEKIEIPLSLFVLMAAVVVYGVFYYVGGTFYEFVIKEYFRYKNRTDYNEA